MISAGAVTPVLMIYIRNNEHYDVLEFMELGYIDRKSDLLPFEYYVNVSEDVKYYVF